VVCQDEETRDWLASSVPTLKECEGSRLKMVGLEALPTYRGGLAWLPGPAEETGRYLQRLRRLNRGLETDDWRVYERMEESNGVRLVLHRVAGEALMETIQRRRSCHFLASRR